jgi:hypothetical protein
VQERNSTAAVPAVLLRGKLLLGFENDRMHVHFVSYGSIAEHPHSVLARGSVKDGQLNQHTSQLAFFRTT